MPDVYENYITFANNMQNLHGTSALAPRVMNSFNFDYDSLTMNATGALGEPKEYADTQQMETYDFLSPRAVLGIGDPAANQEIGLTSERAEIKILIQPVNQFQFRYKSEMTGTHGRLLGETNGNNCEKKFPTVKLINCGYQDAVVRCTLVTADEDRRLPHAHRLVRKYGNKDKDGPHDIKVSDQNDYTASFCNMGIIHTVKKNLKEEIKKKMGMELLNDKRRPNFDRTTEKNCKIDEQIKEAQESMNLNTVCLCFQGFYYGENNVLSPLTEKIYSKPINNLKSVKTCKLKICRIDKLTSSCEGNEEVWLLVKKVDKKNIKVKFYEVDGSNNVIWEAEPKSSELDVHYQYAIVVKTPPYKNSNIIEPVEVLVKLERPSDGAISNSIKFMYKPLDKNCSRKRPRIALASTSLEIPSDVPDEQLLNDCTLETLITLPGDEISSLSQELAKLLNDNECDCDEPDKFCNTNKPNSERHLNVNFDQELEKREDIILKEKTKDDMPLIEGPFMDLPSCDPQQPKITKLNSQKLLQLQTIMHDDRTVTDVHIELVGAVLDKTGGWEKLAQHTKNSSIIRLHRRTSSPSSALLNKIQQQNSELTMGQLKSLLIEVQEYEAATVLD